MGEHLIKSGYLIKGSTTKKEKLLALSEKGILPYHITLEGNKIEFGDFLISDCVIITIPPGNTRNPEFYENQIRSIVPIIPGSTKIIFISSTSVYSNLNKEVTESDATPNALTRSGVSLLTIEKIFATNQTTILRFAGLIGPDRHPGRFFQRNLNQKGGNVPVNLIHLNDCIDVVKWVIEKNLWGMTFNACFPEHPLKMDYYPSMAEAIGFAKPSFSEDPLEWKRVSSQKLLDTGFRFSYPISSKDYF